MYVWMRVCMYVCLCAWMDVYVCMCVCVFPLLCALTAKQGEDQQSELRNPKLKAKRSNTCAGLRKLERCQRRKETTAYRRVDLLAC